MKTLKFRCPSFMDVDIPPDFNFKTKEELLNNKELKRVASLDGFLCFSIFYGNTLMTEYEDGSFWVKGFIYPNADGLELKEWDINECNKRKLGLNK